MEFIQIITGPAIGALIGFGTNYLAIKMLFRPINPIKIGKKQIPFTPGIVPKRKPEIAKAIGSAVGNELFTKEDIKKILLSEEIEKSLLNSVSKYLNENNKTIKEFLKIYIEQNKYDNIKLSLKEEIYDKVRKAILNMNLASIISKEASIAVKEQVKNPLIKIFITDNMLNNISKVIVNKIENYIQNDGKDVIFNISEKEILNIEEMQISEIFDKLQVDEEKIREVISKLYKNLINENIDKLLANFDISKVVEQKINDMSVLKLEKLILKVMKKELNAIVSLGGILGFIIGLLNILVI